jgi:hypothetical protein
MTTPAEHRHEDHDRVSPSSPATTTPHTTTSGTMTMMIIQTAITMATFMTMPRNSGRQVAAA